MMSKNAAELAEVLLAAIDDYEGEVMYRDIFCALERVKSRVIDRMCENTTMPDMKYQKSQDAPTS